MTCSRVPFVTQLLLTICLLALVATTPAFAVNPSPQGVIKRVIVIMQENRTPDSLFYADDDLFAAGGNVRPPTTPTCKQGTNTGTVPLVAYPLDNPCFDPKHLHPDWLAMYNSGAMDGACNIGKTWHGDCKTNNPPASLLCNRGGSNLDGYCPQYTYVENTLYNGSDGILDPLFDIANKYGFSNWTWHTHQGPSFPAHQFLLSGTSAPALYSQTDDFYKWFAAENPLASKSQPGWKQHGVQRPHRCIREDN